VNSYIYNGEEPENQYIYNFIHLQLIHLQLIHLQLIIYQSININITTNYKY